jgi:hypothetical protein
VPYLLGLGSVNACRCYIDISLLFLNVDLRQHVASKYDTSHVGFPPNKASIWAKRELRLDAHLDFARDRGAGRLGA